MDPQNPAGGGGGQQSNADVMAAIASLKTDLSKEFSDRLDAQKAELEERIKPIDTISETLTKAQQAQREAAERQQQREQPGWTPKTWEEVQQMADARAAEQAKKIIEDRDQKAQTEAQRTANDEAQMEAEIDRSLQALEQSGYLPAVYNPNDYNDPGVAARRELLGAASHMGTPELDKVADTLTQLHRQNMLFDPQTKSYISAEGTLAPLPGKFAPVGNSSTSSPSRFNAPSSRELRNSSMDDLIALAEQRGYGPVPTSVVDQPGGF
jgi:multidrug efflux pump subunit AcrA (membrane-fusion protein)